jgi:DNA primase catalytic core
MARFSPHFLDELRQRIRASEVVGRTVRLQQKARSEYVGLCPFHNEKSPSFTVSDSKGFYHCFGCGAHGDVITFLMKKQGLEFADAVAELAREAGMALPVAEARDEEKYQKIHSLYEVLEQAAQWFSAQLNTDAAAEARRYLAGRGLTDADIAMFRIGFSPDSRDALYQTLKAKGISDSMMEEAGLVHLKEESRPLDRFRGRIIFPIADAKGRVVAFGGRIMGDGQPKYLNSPETELFHKGHMLYAWHLARERAFKKANIVAVEGYMDTIALHTAGITNAVAPLGTAVTEHHLAQLWKVAAEPTLCLDGDAAGKRAMRRVAELCLPLLKPGYSLKFAFLPKGQDPDDLIRNEGAAALRQVLMNARPLSEMLWQMEWEENPPTTPEQKAAREKKLMQLAARITDNTVQHNYRQFFGERIRTVGRMPFKKSAPVHKASIEKLRTPNTPAAMRYQAGILRLIVEYPELLREAEVEESLMQLECLNETLAALQQALLALQGHEALPEKDALKALLQEQGLEDSIAYITRQPSFGASKGIANLQVAKLEWEYLTACYDLTLAEAAHDDVRKQFEADVSDALHNRLLEIGKHLGQLKVVAENKKRVYEQVLEAQKS